MRPRQTPAGLGDPEIAISGIGAQTIGLEVLVPVMADGDALFRTHAFCNRRAARFGVATFGLDRFSRGGFGNGLALRGLARSRFFLRGGAGGSPRCRLLLGHWRPPFRFGKGSTDRPASHPVQCSRNTPSTVRSSAGLISLECTTVTANNGPSSFSCQKERKSFNAGKFGNRS